jgi:hypothetical protein
MRSPGRLASGRAVRPAEPSVNRAAGLDESSEDIAACGSPWTPRSEASTLWFRCPVEPEELPGAVRAIVVHHRRLDRRAPISPYVTGVAGEVEAAS